MSRIFIFSIYAFLDVSNYTFHHKSAQSQAPVRTPKFANVRIVDFLDNDKFPEHYVDCRS